MTNEKIAGMVNAYNMGRRDGHEEGFNKGFDKGYEKGYERADSEGCQKAFDNGYEKGYEAAREEFEVVVEVDEDETGDDEEYACTCVQCTHPAEYDAGYADGFGSTELCPENESYPYRTGYLDGQADPAGWWRPCQKGRDWPV